MEWTRGRPLGRGAYGEVFLAIPRNPMFPNMAVKSASGDKATSLFFEHQLLSRFRGTPGIVQCLGGGLSVSGTTYNLLLEYAPGGSLSDLISFYAARSGEDGNGIPENHVRVYTRMILEALFSIHSHGYIHCDIKPGNILVFPSRTTKGETLYELKIADFGLAMERSKLLPWSKNQRGTLRYVPREVVVDGIVTTAMDVWALGCIVVEMLTGEAPWSWVQRDEDVLAEIKRGNRPEIPGWLSEEGKDFLNKCFAMNGAHRLHIEWFLEHPFVSRRSVVGGGGMVRNCVLQRQTQKQRHTGPPPGFPLQKQRPTGPPPGFPLLPHELVRNTIMVRNCYVQQQKQRPTAAAAGFPLLPHEFVRNTIMRTAVIGGGIVRNCDVQQQQKQRPTGPPGFPLLPHELVRNTIMVRNCYVQQQKQRPTGAAAGFPLLPHELIRPRRCLV